MSKDVRHWPARARFGARCEETPGHSLATVPKPVSVVIGPKITDDARLLTLSGLSCLKFRTLPHKLAGPTGPLGVLNDGCTEPFEQGFFDVAVDMTGTP